MVPLLLILARSQLLLAVPEVAPSVAGFQPSPPEVLAASPSEVLFRMAVLAFSLVVAVAVPRKFGVSSRYPSRTAELR